MTKVIGITGGIGSGKTTLSKHLKKIGYLVHESDKFVSSIYKNPNKSFLNFLKKNISKDVVQNYKINKKKVTNIIFSKDGARKKLEKFIHKEVKISRENFIKKNQKNKKGTIFVDIPLLFENNLDKNFDIVVCVISKKKIRTERVLKSKKFTKKILNKIFKSQTSDKNRKSRAQIIIYNNKTKKDFISSAERALIEFIK
jgi:dephospho-CoA kinase